MLKKIFYITLAAVFITINPVIINASASQATKIYSIGDYTEIVNSESIWSIYFRNRNDMIGVDNLINNLDISNWYKASLPGAKDSAVDITGRSILPNEQVYLDTRLFINPFIPGSTFMARPYGASNSDDANRSYKNSIAIGWTAPYSGEWIVDIELYSRQAAANLTDIGPVEFAVAKKPSGTNIASRLMTNQSVNPVAVVGEAGFGERKMKVEAAEGDVIFLFILKTSNLANIASNVRYNITDASNPDIVYDASKIAQNMMASTSGAISPFDFGLSSAADLAISGVPNTSIASASPATLYSDSEYVWLGNQSNKTTDPVFYINKSTGKLTLKPGLVTGTGKRLPLIAFSVSEDGDYSLKVNAKNISASPVDGGWFYLYKLNDSFVITAGSTGLSGGHYDVSEYKLEMNQSGNTVSWEKRFFNLKKGDKLILEACADNTANKLYEMELSAEKMLSAKYDYSINETEVTAFEQVAVSEGDTLDLICNFLNKDNFSLGMLILAIYNADGYMVSACASEVTALVVEDYTPLATSVAIPGDIEGGSVKAFIVEDFNSIRQLIECDILN